MTDVVRAGTAVFDMHESIGEELKDMANDNIPLPDINLSKRETELLELSSSPSLTSQGATDDCVYGHSPQILEKKVMTSFQSLKVSEPNSTIVPRKSPPPQTSGCASTI